MHELSICEAIAAAVVEHAAGRRVHAVHLQVGALRQVVPDSLTFCWSVVGRGPLLDGSRLEIELVPAEVTCAGCGTRDLLSRFVLRCSCCGGPVTVVAGEELLVAAIDVVDEPAAAAPAGTQG